MRPASIVRFERCYLAATLVGFVNSLVLLPALLRSPQTAQALAMIGPGIVYISIGIGVLVPLLLWFFVARRASVAAKWIVVAVFLFAAYGFVRTLVLGFPGSLSGVLGIVTFVLQAVSVFLLFRPDARAWLGHRQDVTAGEYQP